VSYERFVRDTALESVVEFAVIVVVPSVAYTVYISPDPSVEIAYDIVIDVPLIFDGTKDVGEEGAESAYTSADSLEMLPLV
jgi:hypothetical protein